MYDTLKYAQTVVDDPSNILVIGESSHRKPNDVLRKTLNYYKRIKIYMYWLSYDFGDPQNFFDHPRVKHFAQCEYIASKLAEIDSSISVGRLSDFTTARFVRDIALTDPPAATRNSDVARKSDVARNSDAARRRVARVLYNPAKDKLTPLVFPQAVPIQQMTPEQVRELMLTSMVYCDFGHHPGKDRLPREAACCGLVVIVNRIGAANDRFGDIPMVVRRFDPTDEAEKKALIEYVAKVLTKFERYQRKMKPYRSMIANERERFVLETKQAFRLPLVDFVVIGLQKAGTTWLHSILQQHPSIGMANVKELHYFDKWNYHKGREWYEGQFGEALYRPTTPALFGETTPDYIACSDKDIERMYRYNPNMRLIVIYRNAVDRAWSCVHMELRSTAADAAADLRTDDGLFRRMTSKTYVERGDLASGIERYLKYFPKSSFTILRYTDIAKHPKRVKRKLYIGLGVDDQHVSSEILKGNRQVSQDRATVVSGEPNRVMMSDELRTRMVSFYRTIEENNQKTIRMFD